MAAATQPSSPPADSPPADGPGRAGRNLPAAIAVGLTLGAVILVSLYAQRDWFIGVLVAAAWIGSFEVTRALRTLGRKVPMTPLCAGGGAMIVLAYVRGTEALVVGLVLTVIAMLLWRTVEGGRWLVRDIAAGTLSVLYVPFLCSFAALLTAPADGPRRVTAFIATTVCSDVGGYAAGVLFGKHPMAPSVSPKKSWEGFAGSTLACVVAGTIFMLTLFHQDWWKGALLGLAVVAAGTLGDLGESMIKRDIGVKDMGHLLPGHGGIMDRIDSLVCVAPVAYLLLSAFVPLPT